MMINSRGRRALHDQPLQPTAFGRRLSGHSFVRGTVRMERATLESSFAVAVERCIRFANQYVTQHLSSFDVEFRLYPKQSFDENLRVGEVVYPDETLSEGQYLGPWSRDRVLEALWRDGAVPEWVDVAVERQIGSATVVGLLSCGRFTKNHDYLYYTGGDCPPFGVKSPRLPVGWTEGTPFDLHWWLGG